ncbi:MAG: hypothetical protein E6J90_47190 [Deltaproteobacteria bacterium]|nr:MAG: hypothetical protein E6J90_47190 [Deltaproteobacteria bacterium]
MSNANDMSTPVTRGELREELQRAIAPLATEAELASLATKDEIAQLATKAEIAQLATKAELAQAIAPLATKIELEVWGGALLARFESSERKLTQLIERSEQRFQEGLAGVEQRLSAELASHVKAVQESAATMIAGLDDKYKDLPGRVNRLETTVYDKRR